MRFVSISLILLGLSHMAQALQFDMLASKVAEGTPLSAMTATLQFYVDNAAIGPRPCTAVTGPSGSPLKYHFIFNYDSEFLPLQDSGHTVRYRELDVAVCSTPTCTYQNPQHYPRIYPLTDYQGMTGFPISLPSGMPAFVACAAGIYTAAISPVPAQPVGTPWIDNVGTIGCTWSSSCGVNGSQLEFRRDLNGDQDYADGGEESWTPLPDQADGSLLTVALTVEWTSNGTFAFEFRAQELSGTWKYSGTQGEPGITDDWSVPVAAPVRIPLANGTLMTNLRSYQASWLPVQDNGLESYRVRFDMVDESTNHAHLSHVETVAPAATRLPIPPDFLHDQLQDIPARFRVRVRAVVNGQERAAPFSASPADTMREVALGIVRGPAEPAGTESILMLHGWRSDAAHTWNRMRQLFEDNTGYNVWTLDYPNTDDPRLSAGLLRVALDALNEDHAGLADFHLLAHSMGGLVARAYTLGHGRDAAGQGLSYNHDVAALMMMATPNAGGRFVNAFRALQAIGLVSNESESDPGVLALLQNSSLIELLGDNLNAEIPTACLAGYNSSAIQYLMDALLNDMSQRDLNINLIAAAKYLRYTGGSNDVIVTTNSVFSTNGDIGRQLNCHHGNIANPGFMGTHDDRYEFVRDFFDDPEGYEEGINPVSKFITGYMYGRYLRDDVSLSDQVVELYSDTDTLFALTDESGAYSLSYVPDGSYEVVVEGVPGFQDDSQVVQVDEDSPQVTADLVLENDAQYALPYLPSLSIDQGQATTPDPEVELWVGAMNATQVMVSQRSDFSDGVWQGWQPGVPLPFTLAESPELQIVFAKFRDEAGHESAPTLDGIRLAAAPDPGSIQVGSSPAGGQIWLGDQRTNLLTPALVEGLADGEYQVSVRKPGFTCEPAFRLLTVTQGSSPGAEFTLLDSPPQRPSQLQLAQQADSVRLSWRSPSDTDLTRIVWRLRSDGVLPQDPQDGEEACSVPAIPNAHQNASFGFPHSALLQLAAFALDSTGHSSGSTAQLAFQSEAPTPFQLLAPAPDSTLSAGSVTVVWEASQEGDPGDSLIYQLQWADNALFSPRDSVLTQALFFEIDSVSVDSLRRRAEDGQPGEGGARDLPDDLDLWIRVLAFDTQQHLTWSADGPAGRVIHVARPEAPGLFHLLQPPHDAIVATDSLTFHWQASQDPDSGDVVVYHLLLADNPQLRDSLVWSCGQPGCHVDQLLDDRDYWWSVRAEDGQGHLTWASDTSRFGTFFPQRLDTLLLVSPADHTSQDSLVVHFVWSAPRDPDPGDLVQSVLRLRHPGGLFLNPPGAEDSLRVPLTDFALQSGDTLRWSVLAFSSFPPDTVSSAERWLVYLDPTVPLAPGQDPLPTSWALNSVHPNPFNSSVMIELALPQAGVLQVEIYDLLGRRVALVAHQAFPAGRCTLRWQAERHASGIYLLRVANQTGSWSATRKLILVK